MATVRVLIGDGVPRALHILLTSAKLSPRKNAELMSQDSTSQPRWTAPLASSFCERRVAVVLLLARKAFCGSKKPRQQNRDLTC